MKIKNMIDGLVQGPMLYFSKERDLDTMDFRHVVDHILWWHWERNRVELEQDIRPADKVRGVWLHCIGDNELSDKPVLYESPFAVAEHSAGVYGELPIGKAIGIPLVLAKGRQSLTWLNRPSHTRWNVRFNEKAAVLLPSTRMGDVGTLRIYREDRKPLLLPHVKCLHDYCIEVLGKSGQTCPDWPEDYQVPVGQDLVEWRHVVRDADDFLHRHAIKAGFQAFYKTWIAEERNAKYRVVPGPYEIGAGFVPSKNGYG